MRKIVNLVEPINGIVRLMIYNDQNGTYLFGFNKMEDCSSVFDEWYENEIDALESCEYNFRIKTRDWNEIPNPEENCQHDWINPVRVKRQQNSNLIFSKFEKKIDGNWIDFLE